MSNNGLFAFVEGADDERLIDHIYKNVLQECYAWVRYYQYSQQRPKNVSRFIKTIQYMNADYLFFADIDFEPCIGSKKEKLLQKFQGLEPHRIQIVAFEIESWYIAGVDNIGSKALNLKKLPKQTDNFTKEQFNQLYSKSFDSRIDFMKEILKIFSFEQAKKANRSFLYFARRYDKFAK